MRIAIVGGGIAGALLAWRLRQRARRVSLTIYTGDWPGRDASAASGGMVRGFEVAPAACRQAAESLAEIRGSAALRDWSGYQETGSAYLVAGPDAAAASAAVLDQLLPGSAAVLGATDLARRYPFRDLPGDAVAVVEQQAGFISPDRLRARVLAELGSSGVAIDGCVVRAVSPAAGRTAQVMLPDGAARGYDAIVLAAGAWTPDLLRRSGLPGQQLRTKLIQYSVCGGRVPGLSAFVDEMTGLYGRPWGPSSFLIGLPSGQWDVAPERARPGLELCRATMACARRRIGAELRPAWTVASSDCFGPGGGLALRECAPRSAVFTFSGGSGGAAKTIIAASRVAAAALSA